MIGWLRVIASLALMYGDVQAQTWTVKRIVGLEYPKAALVKRLQGSVEINCYIGRDGSVFAEPRSGDPELASAAARNAMRWRFQRITSGENTYRLTYHFRIQIVPKRADSPRFRFVMPDQIFVTADLAPSE